MESLLKSLREYFRHLEKHNVSINELTRKTYKLIESIKNLSEQHRSVSKAEVERMPLGKVPDIKENLLFKIESCIEEEIVELQKLMDECQSKNMVLEKKHEHIKKYLEKVGNLTAVEDRKMLCFGTARYPSVLNMVEWAEDCWKFYHALYLKFSSIILIVQAEDHRKIAELSKNYLYSEERKLFIERVLAMTKKFVDDS